MKPEIELESTGPESNFPGLDYIRRAVRLQLIHFEKPASIRHDFIAGVSGALTNVPDGMANGAILGVNPIFGLYGAMIGPTVGGIFSSTQLMMVTTMAAASLSASQALGDLQGDERTHGLFAMVMMVGLFQILAGIFKLGRFFQFVSYSVITGFLTGVSVLLILNQLSDITGMDLPGGVYAAFRLPFELSSVHVPTLLLAILTLFLASTLPRTRISNLGRLVAILSPTLLILLFDLNGVRLVRDIGEIPSGMMAPLFPPLSAFTGEIVTGALAVALIILVQTAGVSKSVPVIGGMRRNQSRDFAAIGLANAISGLFRGLPIGGSVSGTAMNILYGAQSRWAAIIAGLMMALIIQFLSEAVGFIAMPALGALLILAGLTSIKMSDILHVVHNGWSSRLAGITTFISMLFFPIQAAVGFGVVLSALFYIFQSASDVSIVELIESEDGTIEERHPPRILPSEKVTLLDVYGNLFYAGAQTFERLLPRPEKATRSVVVLRLRGQSSVGTTLIDVLIKYAKDLEGKGGRLYLSGLNPLVQKQITDSRRSTLKLPLITFGATAFRGESTKQAMKESQIWLMESVGQPQDKG